MENQSMFEQANQNTLEIMKKLVVFEDNMTEQLNFLAKQALISAKTEVAFAQIENVPFERLSNLAQQVYKNPEFVLEKKFELTDLIDAPVSQAQDIFEENNTMVTVPVKTKDGSTEIFISKENENIFDADKGEDAIFITQTQPAGDTGAEMPKNSEKSNEPESTPEPTPEPEPKPEPKPEPEPKKPHSQKRREWIAFTELRIGTDCDVRVEIARLTELDKRRAEKDKQEQPAQEKEEYYYNLS